MLLSNLFPEFISQNFVFFLIYELSFWSLCQLSQGSFSQLVGQDLVITHTDLYHSSIWGVLAVELYDLRSYWLSKKALVFITMQDSIENAVTLEIHHALKKNGTSDMQGIRWG